MWPDPWPLPCVDTSDLFMLPTLKMQNSRKSSDNLVRNSFSSKKTEFKLLTKITIRRNKAVIYIQIILISKFALPEPEASSNNFKIAGTNKHVKKPLTTLSYG